MLSDVVFRIQRTARGKTRVVHADRLKLYEGPILVSWVYKAPKEVEEKGPELHKVGREDPAIDLEEVGERGIVTKESPVRDERGNQGRGGKDKLAGREKVVDDKV